MIPFSHFYYEGLTNLISSSTPHISLFLSSLSLSLSLSRSLNNIIHVDTYMFTSIETGETFSVRAMAASKYAGIMFAILFISFIIGSFFFFYSFFHFLEPSFLFNSKFIFHSKFPLTIPFSFSPSPSPSPSPLQRVFGWWKCA